MNDLNELVVEWAEKRNLIKGSNAIKQFEKLKEEVAELEETILNDYPKQQQMLEMGDVLVVLIILCEQLNISLTPSLALAYNKIKNRNGIMYDGIFYKEGDDRYATILSKLERDQYEIFNT